MKIGEVYFWFSEYNYNNECYTVIDDYKDIQEYMLLRVHAGENTFTDLWRISYRYADENKEQFIKIENDAQYHELVKERNKLNNQTDDCLGNDDEQDFGVSEYLEGDADTRTGEIFDNYYK